MNTREILDCRAHRPWPLPQEPWKWRQSWHDFLFIHWRVEPGLMRRFVPASLAVEVFDGSAWLSLVPFRMTDVSLRGVPATPWLSAFLEMNLRTYVRHADKPGVWFFRMDASRALAVWAARVTLGLPYVWSRMSTRRSGDTVHYRSRQGRACFKGVYTQAQPARTAVPQSLEWFLLERYCLYSLHLGRLLRVDIHHAPWTFAAADADIRENTIPPACSLPSPTGDVLHHFANRQDVVGWGAHKVGK